MCGIIAYQGSELSFHEFIQQSLLIKHRGPDNSHHHEIDDIKFGFHRLRINDMSEHGDQPFIDEKVVLLCNGEIYNAEKLIKEYNFKTKSKSDCEVILHLYEKFGDIKHVINKLHGVFAFILYDRNTKTTYVARDPFGVRSLYIGYDKELISEPQTEIMISSELRTMTQLSKAQQFPPNHYAIIKNKNISILSYNQVLSVKKHQKYSENIPKTIYNLLDNAVKMRLLSDRPIGCLLSGGLDSSVIAYLLSTYIPNLNTYSIGLSKDSPDLKYARIVAEHIGSNHHEIILPASDFLDAIPNVINTIESYDTTSVRASVPMYLLCKWIKEHTEDIVIFSGEGSDELFGGYLYFHNAPNEIFFQHETTRLLKDIHYFDGLRSDKSISNNSLESRIPFLDTTFVNYVYNLDPVEKMNSIEKFILRKAFDGCLPDCIIWRQKEAFSDGVSTYNDSWYKIIQTHVENQEIQEEDYTYNPPMLNESKWYRQIFNDFFPNRETVIPYYWLPKWCDNIHDPSARELSMHQISN